MSSEEEKKALAKTPPGAGSEDVHNYLGADGTNKCDIICPFCPSDSPTIIVLSGVCKLEEKDLFLVHPASKDPTVGTMHKDHWIVTKKIDFENVGVRRNAGSDNFRYLTCCACDRGPLGIVFDADKESKFYVTHARVSYGTEGSGSSGSAAASLPLATNFTDMNALLAALGAGGSGAVRVGANASGPAIQVASDASSGTGDAAAAAASSSASSSTSSAPDPTAPSKQ